MKATPTAALRCLKTGVALGAIVTSSLLLTSPANAADRVVQSNLVDQSETRATGHNVFGNDGVRVYTEGTTSTDKAAGYFDAHVALADAGEPTMSWSANAGQAGSNLKPSVQLKVDFDNNGSIDGILVGEPTYADGSNLYGNDWWLSNGSAQFAKDGAPSHEGGSGSANHGTLAQWRTAFGDADIVQAGWSLGSGVKGDGTINSITVGGDEYYFTKADDVTTKTLYDVDVTPDDTRSAGHNVFRPTSGIHVYTDDNTSNAKADGYFDASEPLATAGEPSMDFRTISGSVPPGLQLVVDFDGDGTRDGKLVGEPKFYGTDWWLSNDSGADIKAAAPRHTGGSGSDNHGLLSEWRAEFPDAQVIGAGYSLGSGVKGDFIIDGITVGLTKYTFSGQNRAPSADDVDGSTLPGKAVTIDLAGTDPDEDQLSYTAEADNGTVAINGDVLTYTPDDGFVGTDSFAYTVTDGRGGEATGTVTVDVAKAASTTSGVRFNTTSPSVRSSVTVYATVTALDGAKVQGGTVNIKYRAKIIASGTVNSAGNVRITLPKVLVAGTRDIEVQFLGTSQALPSKAKKSLTVRK